VVFSATFSPDSLRVVTASSDGTARLWNATTGAQLAVFSGHSDFVWSAVFSPDGRRVATASSDDTARLWDAATGAQLAVLSGHTDFVWSAAWPVPQKEAYKTWQPPQPSPIIGVMAGQLRAMLRQNR
jgi:WD40 repeat protein